MDTTIYCGEVEIYNQMVDDMDCGCDRDDCKEETAADWK